MKEQSIEFQINSELSNVNLAAVSISAISKHIGFEETICYQIETCAVEAMNNAIIHAYQKQSGNWVKIKCQCTEKYLQIVISDTGKSMKTPIPNNLVSADQEHGRGWFIMQQWMDQVEYSSTDGINTVSLTKYL